MPLDPQLLAILRCPESRAKLIYFSEAHAETGGEFLFCAKSKLRYRIDEGIPVMLIDDAERLDDASCAALKARAAELGLA